MREDIYILEGEEVHRFEGTFKEFVECGQFQHCTEPIRKDYVDDILVSTIFLRFDHRHTSNGPPILFETMIFGGAHEGFQERYCTYQEAVEGHGRALKLVQESVGQCEICDAKSPAHKMSCPKAPEGTKGPRLQANRFIMTQYDNERHEMEVVRVEQRNDD